MRAFAAGALKHIKSGPFELSLDERTDVAMWVGEDGEWRGAVQGSGRALPPQLAALAKSWIRLSVPLPPDGN